MMNANSKNTAFSYEIRMRNHLETYWATYFEDWAINNMEDGEVRLCNTNVDQAGLHSVLNKIRDLNLTLLSVKTKKDEE